MRRHHSSDGYIHKFRFTSAVEPPVPAPPRRPARWLIPLFLGGAVVLSSLLLVAVSSLGQ
jgi:hypothetical protein